jgi:hypothetical protein
MRWAALPGCLLLCLSAGLATGQGGEKESPLAQVVKEMLATMEKMTTSLSTVKDEATAEAARPDLRKAAASWLEVKHKAKNVKPPTQEEKDRLQREFRDKIQAAHKKLFGEIARVKGVPGGPKALAEISSALAKNSK